MKFELTSGEQICLDMYSNNKKKDNPDPMKWLFLFQALRAIDNSQTLHGMFYGFYDGGGI